MDRRFLSDAQWQLYFALELLDLMPTMGSSDAVGLAARLQRGIARDEVPEEAAHLFALLRLWPLQHCVTAIDAGIALS